jgi:translation initiation factor IF-2
MYKTKLPIVIAFNKIDVVSHQFAQDYMNDFEAFQAALEQSSQRNQGGSYIEDLTRSMSLVLDEFYSGIRSVGVSAATGEGMEEFFAAIDAARQEYVEHYLPEMQRRKEGQKFMEEQRRKQAMNKLKKDLKMESVRTAKTADVASSTMSADGAEPQQKNPPQPPSAGVSSTPSS